MKKCVLLFVILIAVLTLTLVAFSCESDRVGQTAEALDISMGSTNGVVRPNYLPFLDFSDVSVGDPGSVGAFCNSASDFSIVSDTWLNMGTSSCLVSTGALNIKFTVTLSGHYYFACLINSSADVRYNVLGTYTRNGVTTTVTSTDNPVGVSGANARAYFEDLIPGDVCLVSIYCASSPFYAHLVKVEHTETTYRANYRFSGFVVPGVTFDPNDFDVPSSYDSWNGIVYPNFLNNSDFAYYPYYEANANTVPASDMYFTNMPTSFFDNYGYVGTPPMPLTSFTLPNAFGAGVIRYRYTWQDIFYDWAQVEDVGYPLTFTLASSFSDGSCTVTMTDNLQNTVTKVFTSGIDSLTLYAEGVPAIPDYVDIIIEFGAITSMNVNLNYSKLEVGSLFTGYVPLDHNDTFNVNRNYISSYNFAYEHLDSNYVPDEWYISSGNAVCTLVNNNGVLYQTLNCLSDTVLRYALTEYSLTYMDHLTFTLAAQSDHPIDIVVKDNDSIIARQFILASIPQYRDVSSCVFSYVHSLSIELHFAEGSQVSLYNAKLEEGDAFTGFVQDSKDEYNRGVHDVEFYNFGLPRFLEYYNFKYMDYRTPTGLEDGDALPVPPEAIYHGSYGSVHSSDLGLSMINSSSGEKASFTFLSMEVFGGGPIYDLGSHYILALLFSTSTTNSIIDVQVAAGDLLYNYTLNFYNRDQILVIIDFPSGTSFNYLPLTITNMSYSSGLYLTRFKTEFSRFFTGFPDGFDSNRTLNNFYDTGYQNGYGNGLADGTAAGYSAGVAEGKQAGLTEGFNSGMERGVAQGYQEGLQTANNGTWYSLVGALIDVPVTTIVSFLDFDILGFNMLSALKSIMLLSLFFFLIRFFVGKVL